MGKKHKTTAAAEPETKANEPADASTIDTREDAEPVFGVDKLSLNRSLIENFYLCRRLGVLSIWADIARRRAKKDRPPNRGPALRGTVEHEICARYALHLSGAKAMTDLVALEAILGDVFAEFAGLTDDQRAEIETDIGVFASSYIVDVTGLVGIEEPLAMPVDGAEIFGTPDMLRIVGKHGFLTDYKSNWKADTQAEAERNFQLRLYGYMAAETYGLDGVTCSLLFIKSGIERSFVMSREDGDFDKVSARLKSVVGAIRRITYADTVPTPCSKCQYCDYVDDCPMPDTAAPYNGAQAAELAGKLLRLEAQYDQAVAALKAYCSTAGLVRVGNEAFGFHTSSSTTYPVEAMFDRLGKDALSYFNVDGRKVSTKKFLAEYGDRLKDAAEIKHSQRFGHQKLES